MKKNIKLIDMRDKENYIRLKIYSSIFLLKIDSVELNLDRVFLKKTESDLLKKKYYAGLVHINKDPENVKLLCLDYYKQDISEYKMKYYKNKIKVEMRTSSGCEVAPCVIRDFITICNENGDFLSLIKSYPHKEIEFLYEIDRDLTPPNIISEI